MTDKKPSGPAGINYRKWDHIEISDDEDDTHPNVDTPSLFKWRHEARLQRMEEEKAEKAKRKAEAERLKEQKAKAAELLKEKEPTQADDIVKQLSELEAQEKAFLEKERELERMEKEHPKWHVDNISKDKVSRTIINKTDSKPPPEEKQIEDLTEFIKKYDKEIKHFGMLEKPEESHNYLRERPYLMCDHLASFLVIWCVDLQVDEKKELVKRVVRQTVVVQFILELAKSINRDPRQCVDGFFAKLKNPEKAYMDAFEDEYQGLLSRVRERAKVRIAEAMKKQEEEEAKAKKERMRNGLDPLEVLDSLPPKIKKAFEDQNTPMLKEGFSELPPEEARYHYERVVKSGLWVPAGEEGEAGAAAAEGDDEGDDDGEEEDEDEEDEKEGAAAGQK